MRYSYHSEQWLFYPIETLFAFFSNPENLPRLMPEWQKARLEKTSLVPPSARNTFAGRTQSSEVAGAGSQITLSLRPVAHMPIRIKWVAEIDEFAWNDRFCDNQVRGPFAYWKHCHSFKAASEAGLPRTLLIDHVDYELPLGPVGRLAHHFHVRKQIQETFTYRHGQLLKLLGEITTKAA